MDAALSKTLEQIKVVGGRDYNAHSGFVDENGQIGGYQVAGACHSHLNRSKFYSHPIQYDQVTGVYATIVPKYFFNVTQTKSKYHGGRCGADGKTLNISGLKDDRRVELAKKFWAFMLDPATSPYASILKYLLSDPADIMDGYVLGGLDEIPANLFYNFVVAMRFPTEFAHFLERWDGYVQKGVTPALAYWAIWIVHNDSPNSNHHSFDWARVSEEYVSNFVRGTPKNLHGPYYPDARCLSSNYVWGDDNIGGNSGNSVGPKDRAQELIGGVWSKLYPDCIGKRMSKPAWGEPVEEIGVKDDESLITILLKEQERLGLKDEPNEDQ